MESKRWLYVSTITVLVGSASFWLARYSRSADLPQAYTVQLEERSVNTTSGRTVELKRTLARRSDGSTASVQWNKFPGSDRFLAHKRVDLVPERRTVIVAEQVKAKSTIYWSPNGDALANALVPVVTGDFTVVANESLLGYEVVKSLRDERMMRITRWHAPALGNFVLRELWERKAEDGRIVAISEKLATSVQLGEPEPSLFEVALELSEMAPSAADELTRRLFFDRKPMDSETASRLDRDYRESQRFRP
jgi:hypothetical protein